LCSFGAWGWISCDDKTLIFIHTHYRVYLTLGIFDLAQNSSCRFFHDHVGIFVDDIDSITVPKNLICFETKYQAIVIIWCLGVFLKFKATTGNWDLDFKEVKIFIGLYTDLISLAHKLASLRSPVYSHVQAKAVNFAMRYSLLGLSSKISSHYLQSVIVEDGYHMRSWKVFNTITFVSFLPRTS